MATLPSSLALTTISDGALATAADLRNNFTAVQTENNSLLTILGAGTAGDVFSGVGTTVQFAKPPGYEYAYTELTTGNLNITGTTSAAPTTVVTASAVTFDGTTAVVVEFYSPITTRGTANISIGLYEDGTYKSLIGFISNAVNNIVRAAHRFTPSAAAHTYSIRAFVDAGTGVVGNGTGTGGASAPAFIRITKA